MLKVKNKGDIVDIVMGSLAVNYSRKMLHLRRLTGSESASDSIAVE